MTESQYAAFKAEVQAKVGALKAGGIDFGEIATLFKIATGQQSVTFNSLGVELKGWECIKFDVCKDPIINKAPVALADNFSAKEDGLPLEGSVATNDSDVNGDTLTYALNSPAPAGLTFNPNGSFVFNTTGAAYQHLAVGASENVMVNYTVSDGKGGTAVSTLTIKVCGTNDVPTAEVDTNSGAEDTIITGTVASNDKDVDDGHVLEFALVNPASAPAGLTFNIDGSYSFDAGNAAYQYLAEGAKLNMVVNYSVTDEHGASATSTLTITVTGSDEEPTCSCHCTPVDVLTNGSFEGSGATFHPEQGWGNAVISGWTNTGDADGSIEVWNQAGLNISTNGAVATGSTAIETDGWGNGHVDPATGEATKDNYVANVEAEVGKVYEVTFDYAARTDSPGGDTDGFDVLWNGTIVGHFDPDASNVGWQHATIQVTGITGTDKLEIRETGANDAYGALIDNVKVLTSCPPADHKNGALVAEWNFESHTQANGDEVGIPQGFWDLGTYAETYNIPIPGSDGNVWADYTQVHGENGHRALDTAASPGNIFLQAIPEGRGGVLGQGATMPDLVAGKEYHAEVMILRQDYHNDPAAVAAGHDGTDPDAWVEFNFNGQKLIVNADDPRLANGNQYVKFDITFTGIDGEDGFTIMSGGTSDDPQGLLIDSIKISEWVECKPHTGETLFVENFDETPITVYAAPSGPVASGTIDLVAEGWTGTGHNDDFGFTTVSEVAMSNMFGPTEATSGNQFLDTQNTPGQINISHTFTDNTAAIDGKTATLSFDIGKMNIDWGGGYQTNANETFEFRIDDQKVAEFTASQFNDADLHHFDIDISDYADNTDSIHTLSLVNTSAAASTIGFAVDSIQINDWIV